MSYKPTYLTNQFEAHFLTSYSYVMVWPHVAWTWTQKCWFQTFI